MSDAPETIWADMPDIFDGMGFWSEIEGTETILYRRADLPPTDAQIAAHPKVRALVSAATRVVDHYAIVHFGPVGMRTAGMGLMDDLRAIIAAWDKLTGE